MTYTHCFIDMDGTLIDSSPGVTHSVAYALEKCGITPPPRDQLLCFLGPPLEWSFRNYYGMTEEQALTAVAYYRECYEAGAIYECLAYDGIHTMLQRLFDAGIVCVLATSKPLVYAKEILVHLGLSPYFSFLSAPELDGTRNAKAEVIAYAIEEMQIKNKSGILMIGDREHDTLGAKATGVDSVGVLWGFGDREELLSTGARNVYETPKALTDAILSGKI